jgi:hypothetical protein
LKRVSTSSSSDHGSARLHHSDDDHVMDSAWIEVNCVLAKTLWQSRPTFSTAIIWWRFSARHHVLAHFVTPIIHLLSMLVHEMAYSDHWTYFNQSLRSFVWSQVSVSTQNLYPLLVGLHSSRVQDVAVPQTMNDSNLETQL